MNTPVLDTDLHFEEIARIVGLDPSIPHLFKVPLINLCHVEQTEFVLANPRLILDTDAFIEGSTKKRVTAFKRFLKSSLPSSGSLK